MGLRYTEQKTERESDIIFSEVKGLNYPTKGKIR